jgi:hypothetical protein
MEGETATCFGKVGVSGCPTHIIIIAIILYVDSGYVESGGFRPFVSLSHDDNAGGGVNDTVWLLATNPNASVRNGAEAVELAQRAANFSGGNQPAILGTLAAAYAEAGHFPEALRTGEEAVRLAAAAGNRDLGEKIRSCLELYRAGKPYRQAPRR